MARKRMIDPNFWEDQKLAKCPWPARFVFLGLISNSDDAGRLCGHPAILHSRIFHSHDGIALEEMEEWLSNLENENLVVRYRANEEDYIWLPGFFKHQTLNRPSASKLPPPPRDMVRTHLKLIESSRSIHSEENGIEEKRIYASGAKPLDILCGYEAYIGYDFPRKGGKLPGKEMSAAKALIGGGYVFEQICGTHDYLLGKDRDFWGSQPISLQSILKHIDFFVKKHPKTTKDVLESIPDL